MNKCNVSPGTYRNEFVLITEERTEIDNNKNKIKDKVVNCKGRANIVDGIRRIL